MWRSTWVSIPLEITQVYCSTWIICKYIHLFIFISFFIQDALNISSSRTLDNRAIQNFVKNYVDDYVGVYNFVMPFLFCYLLHTRWTLHNCSHTELVNTDNRSILELNMRWLIG